MTDSTTREPANDRQDLERLLVERENAGDGAGMTALFEPDAVMDVGGGTFVRGRAKLRASESRLAERAINQRWPRRTKPIL